MTTAAMAAEPIEVAVSRVEPDVTVETIAEVRTRAYGMKRALDDVLKELDARIIAWIEHNKQDVHYTISVDGSEMILTTKPEKTTKCRDVKAALQELLPAFGGDFDMLADCLAADAWKYGSVRKRLEEVGAPGLFDKLFETTERAKLVDASPKLRAVDTRYLK